MNPVLFFCLFFFGGGVGGVGGVLLNIELCLLSRAN